jgi:hypothetical protein
VGQAGREDVEEMQGVKEVEDRNPDLAAVPFCGRRLTITSLLTPLFAELLNLKGIKPIVFIGLWKCSFYGA